MFVALLAERLSEWRCKRCDVDVASKDHLIDVHHPTFNGRTGLGTYTVVNPLGVVLQLLTVTHANIEEGFGSIAWFKGFHGCAMRCKCREVVGWKMTPEATLAQPSTYRWEVLDRPLVFRTQNPELEDALPATLRQRQSRRTPRKPVDNGTFFSSKRARLLPNKDATETLGEWKQRQKLSMLRRKNGDATLPMPSSANHLKSVLKCGGTEMPSTLKAVTQSEYEPRFVEKPRFDRSIVARPAKGSAVGTVFPSTIFHAPSIEQAATSREAFSAAVNYGTQSCSVTHSDTAASNAVPLRSPLADARLDHDIEQINIGAETCGISSTSDELSFTVEPSREAQRNSARQPPVCVSSHSGVTQTTVAEGSEETGLVGRRSEQTRTLPGRFWSGKGRSKTRLVQWFASNGGSSSKNKAELHADSITPCVKEPLPPHAAKRLMWRLTSSSKNIFSKVERCDTPQQ